VGSSFGAERQAAIYGWDAERFDTADLKETEVILSELA